MGWGGFVKPKKSKQQVALERRRELGVKFFTPIDELVSLAATAKVKIKRLPCVPPEYLASRPPLYPGAPTTGPCQTWVDGRVRSGSRAQIWPHQRIGAGSTLVLLIVTLHRSTRKRARTCAAKACRTWATLSAR
jgi:hypothetical protein